MLLPNSPILRTIISLQHIGKKFGREWIFRNLSLEIDHASKLVILGGNGSGKSTLLQIVSGFVTPNEGRVLFTLDGKTIDDDQKNLYISLASPYLQLIEDFTAQELVEHVGRFKPFCNQINALQVLEIAGLEHARNKYIKHFSSGMKQRLRLSLAILADTPILLLDEPLSNLDKNAIVWYRSMIDEFAQNKTVLVCSNAIDQEFYFCDQRLDIASFKTAEKTQLRT